VALSRPGFRLPGDRLRVIGIAVAQSIYGIPRKASVK
jgi:hypothetical protein